MTESDDPNGETDTKLAARRTALRKIAVYGAAAPAMVAMLSATKAMAASTGDEEPAPAPSPTPDFF